MNSLGRPTIAWLLTVLLLVGWMAGTMFPQATLVEVVSGAIVLGLLVSLGCNSKFEKLSMSGAVTALSVVGFFLADVTRPFMTI